jgi:phytanoyl-CoA hydroxylase
MLTREQIEQFHRDGFLNAGPLLTDEQVGLMQEEVLRVIRDRDRTDVPQPNRVVNFMPPDKGEDLWQIVNIWEASEIYRQVMYSPKIVEDIATLLEAKELRLWHDQIQYKPAGNGAANMWHQDSPYWSALETKDQQITAWIALDDVDADNGCMSMVPGSHRWGVEIEFLHTLKQFDGMPAEYKGHPVKPTLCPVKKGHVHYHHALTWHGSHENRSGRPRRAIAYHFMSEKTLFSGRRDHPTAPYIQVEPGQPIKGEKLPLVWQNGRAVPMPELATA